MISNKEQGNILKKFTHYLSKILLVFLCLFSSTQMLAAGLGSLLADKDIDATADQLDFVGDNIIATGHVAVQYKDIWITADKAVINLTTKEIDATGRVSFIQRSKTNMEVDYKEYLKLLKDPNSKITVNGYVMTPTGRQKLQLTVIKEINNWTGKRAVGNLTTGIFDLGAFSGRNGVYYISGGNAERKPGGNIMIKDAKVTTCEYVKDNHEHYSLSASSVELYPKKSNTEDEDYQNPGEYHMIVWNAWLKVGGFPIFYFPFLYKPPDDSLGLGIQLQGGSDSKWGYFVQTSKTLKFNFWDAATTTKLMLDYYSKRGIGGGVDFEVNTTNSYTNAFIYGVRDKEYGGERIGRFDYDSNRYDMYISHLTHITPRLDVRAHMELLSDSEILHDFFKDREDTNPQPTSFVSLEYQFDRLSLGTYVRPRLNDFYSVAETLPEVRLDIPRQELFKNLYYQGETSAAYMKMKWRDYDYARASGGQDISDYESGRFDTLHMFYYPFKIFDSINLIPRAGVRLTAYSKTSKGKVTQNELESNYIVDSPTTDRNGTVTNYDSKGGGKIRFASEFGLEMNAKFYRSWDNAKSAFWGVDGLRHVMVPYVNYNYIPGVTLNRDKIYYFDDVDRIIEQNFVRVGIKNRLETRRGAYGEQEIYTWASVENYVDFHFQTEDGFDNMGDFGTIFKWNPFPEFQATTDLLIDVGGGSISRFSTRFDYDITENWKVFAGYLYQNDYTQRSVYSMGSSLTDITSGSSFTRSYGQQQSIFGGLEFPIWDERTRGKVSMYYDLEQNMINEARFGVKRIFHCWEAGVEWRVKQRNDDVGEGEWENTFMFTLSLTDLPSVKIAAKSGANN